MDETSLAAEIQAALNVAEQRPLARELCFQALSTQPKKANIRLALAKLFYLDGMFDFALRELAELKKQLPENSTLQSLLEALGAGGTTGTKAAEKESRPPSEIIAEVELEADFDELLEEEGKS